VRSLLEDVTADERAHGRFGKTERGYHFIPVDTQAMREEQEGLKSWVALVLQTCDVRGCQEHASLAPEKREELTSVLGQHNVESMILAVLPGHVLWTDDLILAKIASSEFGTRHVWTQIAVEHGFKRGYLDEEIYVTVSAKLLGFNYRSTTFNQAVVLRTASLGEWNPNKWPFKQVLEQFANESIDLSSVIGLAATTIVALYREALLVGARQSVLIRIAEKLASRREGFELVKALITILPRLFGLNVLGLEEARGVLGAWLVEALRRPFFRF